MHIQPTDREATEALLAFIRSSPTAYQATGQIARILEEAGFSRLEEAQPWQPEPGAGYYVTRNQSAVIAFRTPREAPAQMLLAASHTDSPMFKLKADCLSPAFGTYLRLNTEVYGGTVLSSWLDRPLSLAGRVVLRRQGRYEACGVVLDRDLLLIPGVAIHMNRSVNSGYAYNPAVDMLPLFSAAEGSPGLTELLAQELSCTPEEIAGADLYVYNRMPGSIWGAGEEFFSAPRIDNLMCVYGTLRGFIGATPRPDSLNLYYAADNEETGSATRQGAGSVFLSDVLDRLCRSLGADRSRLLASSFMVSADNGHARHPNHPELSDGQNAPALNGGVVIKSNAAQRYATDGFSAALFEGVCRQAGVPVQRFANRSDLPGGSTLGSISNTLVPLCTVDIGMAQLAMHSAYETAGTADTAHLIRAMQQFYGAGIASERDGVCTLSF